MQKADVMLRLLRELEQALKDCSLWEESPPSAQALASALPFCADALSTNQWLQWVLIPRLRQLLDAGRPLPVHSAILPYAEFALAACRHRARVLSVVRKLDELLAE